MAAACACASVSAGATATFAVNSSNGDAVKAPTASARVSFSSPIFRKLPTASSFHGKPLTVGSTTTTGLGSIKVCPSVRVRAVQEETSTSTTSEEVSETSEQVDQLVKDIQAKWEAVENKQAVALYAGGALVALWLSSTVVSAVNSVPLLPKVLELVGLGYTSWFVYRYLLFKQSREELGEVVEELKAKITGTSSDE